MIWSILVYMSSTFTNILINTFYKYIDEFFTFQEKKPYFW